MLSTLLRPPRGLVVTTSRLRQISNDLRKRSAKNTDEKFSPREIFYPVGELGLGVSNVTLEQLQSLIQKARIRPRFVQNRCYAARGWDRLIREFCSANSMIYQGFSLLTGNRDVLTRPELVQIAKRYGRTVSQVVFRFSLDVGMLPLTGTTSADHMRADLDIFDFSLEPAELQVIERLAVP